MIYRGNYNRGETYDKGDAVYYGGSCYVANKETKEAPEYNSKDWDITARKGRDGANAYKVAKNNGFTGTEQEWLDSLGQKKEVRVKL